MGALERRLPGYRIRGTAPIYKDIPAEQFMTTELNLPPLRAFGTEAAEAA